MGLFDGLSFNLGKVSTARAAARGSTPTMMDVNPSPPGTNPRALPGQLTPPGGGFQSKIVGPSAMMSRTEIAKTQQFLRNRGYNIAVDGELGPSTASALNDYQMGGGKRDAIAWTQKNRPVDDGRPENPRGPNNNQQVDRDGSNIVVSGKGTKVTYKNAGQLSRDAWVKENPGANLYPKPKKKGDLPAGKLSNIGGDGSVYDKFDPDVLARAQMEAKYGPQIAELLRQEKAASLSGQYRADEIRDMYGTYVKDIKNSNIDAANSRQGMVAATQGLVPAISKGIALGEDELKSLAQTGDIESDYAGQMAQAGNDYDKRMASAAEGGGVFARQQALDTSAANVKNIQSERSDAVAARGADLVAAKQALMQWQAEQQQSNYEFEVGAASDRNKDSIAIAQLRAANAMAPIESRLKQAELDNLLASIGQTKAETAQIGKSDPVDKPFPKNFVDLDVPNRGQLQADILKQIAEQGVKGTPRIVQLINARLRGMNYKPVDNKAVGEFAYQTAKAAGATGVSRKYWKLK